MNPQAIEAQFRAWFGSEAGVSAARIQGERALYAEEEPCVANSVPSRRSEFSTGRWCAREALRALGIPPSPILAGPLRGPVWPPGLTGSITHDGGLCAAVAVRLAYYPALGIDLLNVARAEPVVKSAEAVLHAPGEDLDSPVVRFSAKESVIKAVSNQMGRWVDFTEVHVRVGPSSFQASVAGLQTPVRGWWAAAGEFILTGAVLG